MDGFLFVFGKLFQTALAIRDSPELVHDVGEAAIIDKLFHSMDKIADDWIAYLGVFNHVGVVEADNIGPAEVDFILKVIKHPAKTVSTSPFANIGIERIITSIG